MDTTENIISIRRSNKDVANAHFADFMSKTESYLNEKAAQAPSAFKKISASDLEVITVRSMKEICASTPFRAEEIKLVSGQSFPDIITENFYGVEVKSTQADSWKSTGSSIIETTRIKSIENIYMLFGKLGGKPAIKCRPYEECLYDITVTHSPRYLIDMSTEKDKTIFAKMHTSYNELRTSKNSISQVRKYYREKALREKKGEMPWWLEELEDSSNSMMLKHISSLTEQEKRRIITQLYILFPERMINHNYMEPAMWLVAYHKVVCHNMRDIFSAGGQAHYINGHILSQPIPAIVKRFVDYSPLINEEIENMYALMEVFNPSLLNGTDVFQNWVEQVHSLLQKKFGETIMFKQWIANGDILTV